MRLIAVLIGVALLALPACGSKKDNKNKPKTEEQTGSECETVDDCSDGKMCLDGHCVDTSQKGIYTDTAGSVTPDKVRRELERSTKKQQEKLDRGLNMDE